MIINHFKGDYLWSFFGHGVDPCLHAKKCHRDWGDKSVKAGGDGHGYVQVFWKHHVRIVSVGHHEGIGPPRGSYCVSIYPKSRLLMIHLISNLPPHAHGLSLQPIHEVANFDAGRCPMQMKEKLIVWRV